MKNAKTILTAFALLLSIAAPTAARADSFSFSYSDGYPQAYAWDRGHYGPRHWHRRPVIVQPSPIVYVAPPPPPRTVVYSEPAYVVSPTMIANQASPTFYNQYGQTCREYQATGYVGGGRAPVYGTACLQPDGAWRVVN